LKKALLNDPKVKLLNEIYRFIWDDCVKSDFKWTVSQRPSAAYTP